MRILQTVAIIAMACVAAAQDTGKLNLTRQFKEGSVRKYKISLKIEEGPGTEIKGLIEAKEGKADKDGKAEVEFKISDFSVSGGGGGGDITPGSAKYSIDKQNMPETLNVEGEGALYVALSLASYLPAKELAKGESFTIDWKGKNDGGLVSGKGSVTEVKTVDNVKIVVVKSSIKITPAGQSEPADLEILSEFNAADGTLMKSSAKGNLPTGGGIDFSLALAK